MYDINPREALTHLWFVRKKETRFTAILESANIPAAWKNELVSKD